jgi:hypothetical protein
MTRDFLTFVRILVPIRMAPASEKNFQETAGIRPMLIRHRETSGVRNSEREGVRGRPEVTGAARRSILAAKLARGEASRDRGAQILDLRQFPG